MEVLTRSEFQVSYSEYFEVIFKKLWQSHFKWASHVERIEWEVRIWRRERRHRKWRRGGEEARDCDGRTA